MQKIGFICSPRLPAPASLPRTRAPSLSGTGGKAFSLSKYVLNIENAKEKGQEGGEYRRGDDNEKADGDKAKVDDQPDVEEGEVAEGGHQLPVGVDQRGPEAELGVF